LPSKDDNLFFLTKKFKSLNKNTLLVGGEGYIGVVVRDFFLKKKINVTSIDKLIYSQKYNKISKNHKNYKFINTNFTSKVVSKLINSGKIDNLVILAGLVGDPITKKYPKISKKINYSSMKKLIDIALKNNVKKLIFVSTCSNYGVVRNGKIAKENTNLDPRSIYAKNKVMIERYLNNKKNNATEITILRFATAFGFSKRMRFDLTINQFVREIIVKKKIEVYDPFTWRPYCHVKDFAYLIYLIVSKKKVKRKQIEIFNSGSSKNNMNKMMIIKKISKFFNKFDLIIKKNSDDPRNYKVDFSKVKKIYGFTPKISIEKGIKELIYQIKKKKLTNLNYYKDKLGNYKIHKNV